MNGSNAFQGEKIGETFNEWISFGVESEPLNYIFSGTVFNDNGGIDDNSADANTIGGIYNNNDYFNSVLNSTEAGIAGSRVRLVDNCSNPTQTFATQTLTSSNAGRYQFNIPVTQIGNRSSVCIIEDNNTGYPIRTTIDKRQVSFTANNYTYVDNNFDRVITKNAALVLEKEQAVNPCTITSLTALTYTKNSISDIPPGQCIAYKITATNRANMAVNNFVMQDTLQKKDINGALVTSTLNTPRYNESDYAPNSVALNDNGVVVTNSISLAARGNKTFYFNTKYGTTQSPSS